MSGPDFDDHDDFADADRGFIASLEPGLVRDADGRVVWDVDAHRFLDGDCPDTVHPSLWRQAQLCARQGLFQVTEEIYQLRGLDLSNMTIVEGDRGVIVIDPLISAECAAAGLTLYRAHRGDRPVTAVIYTHAHTDHFGGVLGVISAEDDVPIIAPEDFLEHAVAENVYAGAGMQRRGSYMYGPLLKPGVKGPVSAGLGVTISSGTVGLLPPTVDITRTGQEETIDGVRVVFQLTPDTEAPAEMNFLFPDQRALCMAENATHNLHNLLTLRGALVRDARIWSRYLTEAITLFTDRADVVFASHHWPIWGRDRMLTFLTQQRDLYAYLHDQTLRLLNTGYTGLEIAEILELPPALDKAWHARGYYGSVSHNVKAIYQRYLGWFDGHPSSLWEHPPVESALRYVDCLGGQAATVDKAQRYTDKGDLRFAAQLLKHAVFADPADVAAKNALADVYERLGFGAENGTWRNFYLAGALELREGIVPNPLAPLGPSLAAALTIDQLFDSLAIRVNGPNAWHEHLTIDWHVTDTGRTHRMTLSNGALIHFPEPLPGRPDLIVTLSKTELLHVLASGNLDSVDHTGDPSALHRLLGLLDSADPDFPIVTP